MDNISVNQNERDELQTEIKNLRSRLADMAEEQTRLHNPESSIDVLIDTAMFPIVLANEDDGAVVYINNYAADYFSISVQQAQGRKAADFWGSFSQLKKFIQLLAENGRVVEFETVLLTTSLEQRNVLLSARKITYQGRPTIYTVFSDITDRKMAEIALQESEARYQDMYRVMKLMANTVPDMIWAKDLENRYIFANKAICEKLLMCKRGESPLGKRDLFFASRERSEGQEHTFGEICVDSDSVVVKSRKPGRFLEDGLVRGKYLALDVQKAPLFNENGNLIGTVGTGRDVTKEIAIQKALEESDKRFRLLVENIRDVLWVSDLEFNPTYVSPSVQELSGYTQDEFLSMPISMHMTPKYQKKYNGLRRMMASLIKKKKEIPARFFEFECLRKDGACIWVEILTTAMWDSDGSLKGLTGVIRDSTKRVREQKELELAKEIALAASQTKSEFLANMSHEIRTPMNGVLGILQLMKDTPLNKTQKKYVETALSSGKSLLNLISDILDFSKIEAGRIELINSELPLEPLLKSVVESFRSLIVKEKVMIDYSIEESVPSVVLADESRLKQILFNLVGNAVKFTEHGKITIELNCDTLLPDGHIVLHFKISDTGKGVPQKIISRLFEPFVQGDGSFRRRYGGTGLGLSIVKKLVEVMGGKIELQSIVNQGTVVCFDVKAGLVKKNASKQTIHFPKKSVPMKTKRILIVEDEKINALVISAILRKLGHEIHLASNGLEALQIIQKSEFDYIFMDIQMPELDGVETTRAIRARAMNKNSKVPIIALTAHAMKGDRERFIAAGMDDYLTKPIEVDKLVEVLQRLQERAGL